MTALYPRLVVTGQGGDAGKTLVCLALLAAWREEGVAVSAFKKGPDYIDRAWLAWASGRQARNLDAYLMPLSKVLGSFRQGASGAELALVEGNRGLYDGLDAEGTYSTAELAKSLAAPVVLILDAAKTTRTLAAVALGMQHMDPACPIGGVILNRVSGARHEAVLCQAVAKVTGLPVLGVVPRQEDLATLLPDRHLGLVTPEEHTHQEALRSRLVSMGKEYLDLQGLRSLAEAAPELPEALPELPETSPELPGEEPDGVSVAPPEGVVVEGAFGEEPDGVSVPPPEGVVVEGAVLGSSSLSPLVEIGYFSDRAFTFYYPENLAALEAAGARLVPVSATAAPALPLVHALYIGGGFPETQAAALRDNAQLRGSVNRASRANLPIYAECGGLMYLCRSLEFQGEHYEMAGVFPLDLKVETRPQGHGYMEILVDGPNPFFREGTRLRGHEFHYSRVAGSGAAGAGVAGAGVAGAGVAGSGAASPHDTIPTAYAVTRGVGAGAGRDGLLAHQTLASYLHLHTLGTPEWAPSLVAAARRFRDSNPVFPD